MSGLAKMIFSGPDVPEVKTPAAPQPEDPSVEEARNKVKVAAKMAKGRQSTIMTGGLGLTAPAPVATKRLLGE